MEEIKIGTRLKEARFKAGMTNLALAKAASLSAAKISGLEQDKAIPMTPDLEAIAAALGCDINTLLTEDELRKIKEYEQTEEGRRRLNISLNMRSKITAQKKAKTAQKPNPKKEVPAEDSFSMRMGEESRKIAKMFREKRENANLTVAELAAKACISPRGYAAFEDGQADLGLTAFGSVCKVLKFTPSILIGEVYDKRWNLFISESPKDVFAFIGICSAHNLEYIPDVENGAVQVFCEEAFAKKLIKNLAIKGEIG